MDTDYGFMYVLLQYRQSCDVAGLDGPCYQEIIRPLLGAFCCGGPYVWDGYKRAIPRVSESHNKLVSESSGFIDCISSAYGHEFPGFGLAPLLSRLVVGLSAYGQSELGKFGKSIDYLGTLLNGLGLKWEILVKKFISPVDRMGVRVR